jgi:hypothetical protein
MAEPPHRSHGDEQVPAWLQKARAEPPRPDPFADLSEREKRLMEFPDHNPTELSASSAPPRSRPTGLISRLRRIPRGLLAIFRDPDFSPIDPRPLEKPQVIDRSGLGPPPSY